jgi:hypothetical protein
MDTTAMKRWAMGFAFVFLSSLLMVTLLGACALVSNDAVQAIFATFSILQVFTGFIGYVWAARRSLRGETSELVASGVE